MKPLIVLLTVFVISAVSLKIAGGNWNPIFSANLAMTIMLCFAAMGHFMYTKGMMMVPQFLPFKKGIVYITGIAEILFGLALLFTQYRETTGIALIVFFILMLPANISAAIQHVDYEKGTNQGKGKNYLWFRVPLQILFIVWVYLSAVYHR